MMTAIRLATCTAMAPRASIMTQGTRAAGAQQHTRCLLSSQTTVAIEKLRTVLEQYRLENYTRELPSRFKKEVIHAAAAAGSSWNNDRTVPFEGMQRVLANIGASNRISFVEMKSIFDELGNGHGEIQSKKLMQFL